MDSEGEITQENSRTESVGLCHTGTKKKIKNLDKIEIVTGGYLLKKPCTAHHLKI